MKHQSILPYRPKRRATDAEDAATEKASEAMPTSHATNALLKRKTTRRAALRKKWLLGQRKAKRVNRKSAGGTVPEEVQAKATITLPGKISNI